MTFILPINYEKHSSSAFHFCSFSETPILDMLFSIRGFAIPLKATAALSSLQNQPIRRFCAAWSLLLSHWSSPLKCTNSIACKSETPVPPIGKYQPRFCYLTVPNKGRKLYFIFIMAIYPSPVSEYLVCHNVILRRIDSGGLSGDFMTYLTDLIIVSISARSRTTWNDTGDNETQKFFLRRILTVNISKGRSSPSFFRHCMGDQLSRMKVKWDLNGTSLDDIVSWTTSVETLVHKTQFAFQLKYTRAVDKRSVICPNDKIFKDIA